MTLPYVVEKSACLHFWRLWEALCVVLCVRGKQTLNSRSTWVHCRAHVDQTYRTYRSTDVVAPDNLGRWATKRAASDGHDKNGNLKEESPYETPTKLILALGVS